MRESKQSAKTANQHSKNPDQKKRNENKSSICAQKSVKKQRKTQTKRQTKVKYYPPPKSPRKQTANGRKGSCLSKQHGEANLATSQSLLLNATLAKISFPFHFLNKKSTNQNFLKQNQNKSIGRELGCNYTHHGSLDRQIHTNQSGVAKSAYHVTPLAWAVRRLLDT